MKLYDVHIETANIKRVTVHPSRNESVTVYADDCFNQFPNYNALAPYIDSNVFSIFLHSEELSIHLEDTSSESGDHEDEMPELGNIRECMNEFFDYAESCEVGALL